MCKKLTAVLMALILAMGCVSALAENTKHERVFVVAGADGTVQSLTDSIRLENADKAEEIRDRTMLTGILNAGGDEAFTLEGEALTWAANGKDIVYQGTSDKALPVVPTVSLALDGETVTAEELAGRSGHAELAVTFTHAESVPYLAAVVMLLPETGIANLQAENAVVIYFSHNDVIKEAAEFAAEARDLDLIEIVTKKDYPDDPVKLAETIREEREKDVRPALKDQPENLDGYDIIFLGFPVWDGSIPMAVASFLEDYDMVNKAIVPFCYAEDGSVGESLEAVARYCRYSAIVSAYMIPTGDFRNNEPVFEGWMTQVLFG